VNLAADLADRIRSNRRGGPGYDTTGAVANNNCDPGGGVNCTPAQMAAHDLWVWTNQVAQQLPNGAGVVQYAATVPPTFTIQITWQETGLGAVNYQSIVRVPTL
jgi:type IV pilus assembly protein PilV